MKKLLTVLCVAAFGIGAAAQAQIEVNPSVSHIDRQVVRQTAIETPAMPMFETPQFQQAGKKYDTLHQPGEYDDQNPDCARYIYCLRWSSTGYFEDESDLNGYGSNMNGTGEIGVTFETQGNIYYNYSGHNLNNYVVVGALALAYRQGSTKGWEKGHDISQFGTHVREMGDAIVPDLPFKMAGYYVLEQDAVEDYLTSGEDYDYVSVKMPVSLEGRAETEVDYLPLLEPADNNGKPFPDVRRYGGMFNKAIDAGNDFGLSFHAQLTGDATYDSLWNFALATRSAAKCVMLNNWITWQRVDYSNPTGWNGLQWKDGSVIIPADDLEEGGFKPEGCPQHDNGNSLFVTWGSQLFRTGEEFFYPCLFAIIQEGKADNEKEQDAYAQTISVYPMPASDKVNMVSLDPMQRIEIYNMAGSLLKQVTLNESVAEMDVTGMAPGTYIARIVTEKGVASKKLLVK